MKNMSLTSTIEERIKPEFYVYGDNHRVMRLRSTIKQSSQIVDLLKNNDMKTILIGNDSTGWTANEIYYASMDYYGRLLLDIFVNNKLFNKIQYKSFVLFTEFCQDKSIISNISFKLFLINVQ